MAENNNNNDPSKLYDEEFMKKREAMFANADSDLEVSSGRETDEFEDFDAEKLQPGGLFARFKRSLRKKKDYDDDDDDDGYDIFDLDDIFKKEESKENEQQSFEEKITDTEEKSQESHKNEVKKPAGEEKVRKQKQKKQKKVIAEVSEEKKEAEKTVEPEKLQTEEPEMKAEEPDEIDDVKIYDGKKENKPEDDFTSDLDFGETSTDYAIDDINALLESVGIKPLSTQGSKPEITTEEVDVDAIEMSDEAEDESGKVSQSTKRIDGKLVKAVLTNAKKKTETVSSNTKLFNIGKLFSSKGKSEAEQSEEEMEAKLHSKRKRFIDNFRVLENETQDKPILERISEADAPGSVVDIVEPKSGEDLFDAVEKADKEKNSLADAAAKAAAKEKTKERNSAASSLMKDLRTKNAAEKTKMIILLALTGVCLILSFIASAYHEGSALDGFFAGGARIYTVINLVLFAAGAAVCFDKFKESIEALKEFKINSSVGMLLICAFVFIQGIIAIITGMTEQTGILVFTAFGLFVMLSQVYSDFLSRKTLVKNLSVMVHAKGAMMGLFKIDSKSDAAAIGHGISENGSPNIYYCADCDIPDNMQQLSSASSFDEKFYGYGSVAVMALTLIVSLVLSITGKTPASFVACFVGGICLCFPILKRVVNERLLSDCVTSVSSKSVAVAGIEACDEIARANAVVVDSDDIFEARVSKFRVVPGHRIAQSDAVVFAAATLKNTKSLLSCSFDEFLEESGITLPEAEDVQYEEHLGYSSWVASRKVLVGNREMLVAHSIPCPSAEEEERYSKGRSVMYVVVEGVIAATFIVSYYAKGEAKKGVAEFSKTGLVLMINSAEPCLSETLAASKLSVDIAAIKIIGSNGAEIVQAYKKSIPSESFGLLYSKKHGGVITLINAAHNLSMAQKLAQLISIVTMAVTFLIFVISMVFGSVSVLTQISIILLNVLWAVVSYFVGKTKLK